MCLRLRSLDQVREEDVASTWGAGAILAGYAHLVYAGKIEPRR